jgi:hypothetical protein
MPQDAQGIQPKGFWLRCLGAKAIEAEGATRMSNQNSSHFSWFRVMKAALLATLAASLAACVVVPGRHGRVGGHVRVALPVPVIPIPVPVPRHEPEPAPYPTPSPHPYPSSGYPSSGSQGPGGYPQAGGALAMFGVVRQIDPAVGRHAGTRVTVQLDDRSWRQFEAPWGAWRVGDRVRMEGDRIHRG